VVGVPVLVVLKVDLARARAGRSIPARIARIAMTTRSSIKVKADPPEREAVDERGTAGDMDVWISWMMPPEVRWVSGLGGASPGRGGPGNGAQMFWAMAWR
jgi:hypothetical protein